jgi:hypothetical protein
MIVVEYRKHSEAMSNDFIAQLKGTLLVLDLDEKRVINSEAHRVALREGRVFYRSYYVSRALSAASTRWRARHDIGILVGDFIQAARWSPLLAMRALLDGLRRRAIRVPPRAIIRWMERIRGRS